MVSAILRAIFIASGSRASTVPTRHRARRGRLGDQDFLDGTVAVIGTPPRIEDRGIGHAVRHTPFDLAADADFGSSPRKAVFLTSVFRIVLAEGHLVELVHLGQPKAIAAGGRDIRKQRFPARRALICTSQEKWE